MTPEWVYFAFYVLNEQNIAPLAFKANDAIFGRIAQIKEGKIC